MIFPNFEPGLLCFPQAGGRNPYFVSTNLRQALPEGNGDSPVSLNLHFADEAARTGSHLKQQCAGQTLPNLAFADIRWV